MQKIILIADDLTGACDSGVQFTRKGMKAAVFFEESNLDVIEADVIIFDTDSRALTQIEAYQVVDCAAAKLDKASFDFIYKKIDSTLRGNIGSEIDALMDRLGFDVAIIAPALPALNRVTRNGIHYLNGEPIENTEIAKDPKTPVTDSNIVRLISNQSKREAILFPKGLLHLDNEAIAQKTKDLIEKNKSLFVFDAENTKDLEQIAASMQTIPYRILWVGSAGLAECLVPEVSQVHVSSDAQRGSSENLPVLIVSGSRSSVAKRQVDTLRRLSPVKLVSLIPEKLLETGERELEITRCQKEIESHLKNNHDVILNVEMIQNTSVSDHPELPYVIVEVLGKIACKAVESFRLQGIVLTGGDTAKSISKELGVTGIELIGEVERGMPFSRMLGGPELLTVTKAGAFGSDMSFYHALKHLKGEENQ
jgi:D-threonate/D-erythronate kinase